MGGAERFEMKKCDFWNGALSLEGCFWYARGGYIFGNLYYTPFVSFVESFTHLSSRA